MKKDNKKKNLIFQFAGYYKPHLALFMIDLGCALLMAICNLVYPSIARRIMNVYAPGKQVDQVVIWGCIMLAIFLFKAVLTYSVNYWGHLVGVRIQSDMRKQLFAHLEKLPFSYYDETKIGSIMSRIVNDLFEISEMAHHGPEDLFISIITIIGSLIMIIPINPWLSLIVFVFIPPILILAVKARRDMKRVFKVNREKTSQINARVESSLSGIRVSKSYTAEKHEIEKFEVANGELVDARKENYLVLSKFQTTMNLGMDILYLVTLVAGGLFFCFGLISPGDMAAYILYISMLLNPVRVFVTLFEQIEMGMSGFERFREIMDIAPEKDKEHTISVDKLEGNIKFDNVSFAYDKAGKEEGAVRNVIQNLSLNIEKGHTVALVGPSGGGKTTMCNLIPRFYEIDSGKITIDGIDIYDMTLFDLRKNIGIVQQDVFLYGGTVKENIAYGKLDATDEEIEQAAKLANIHDYIMSLPDGYETYVGERGIKLSGGQKQRVSIARAFLKNPPILILDEATSALDNVTEMQIQESLSKLSAGRTTIVVAHRLSTIKKADEIIVVTQDGIVERGTHTQLLEKDGVYAQLYKYQFNSYAEN